MMWKPLCRALLALFVVTSGTLALAQDEPAESPSPQTTGDPNIDPHVLEWMLRPLTVDELAVEADAWRDLVAAKVKAEAEAEIEVLGLNDDIDEAETAADEAAADQEEGVPDAGAAEDASDAAVEAGEDAKAALLERLTALREERTALIERAQIVLSEWQDKGGDLSAHKLYLDQVAGVEVNVADLAATKSAVLGWLTSQEGGIKWGLNIVKAMALLVFFWLLARLVRRIVNSAVGRTRLSSLMKNFVTRISGRLIVAIGLVMAVSALGVNVGPLLAIVGAAGFVVAFALQDSLGNFASGIMILLYRPFDVGDLVEVAGVLGRVDSLNLVSTTIRTLDNKVVVVPNNTIWGGVITNATGSHERRVDLVFGIGYEDDIALAQSIMEKAIADHDKCLKDPEPVVRVHELADSSVNFICRPWVKTDDYWDVYWDLTRTVKEEFDRQGVSIPFPQRDVHMYQHSNGSQASAQNA